MFRTIFSEYAEATPKESGARRPSGVAGPGKGRPGGGSRSEKDRKGAVVCECHTISTAPRFQPGRFEPRVRISRTALSLFAAPQGYGTYRARATFDINQRTLSPLYIRRGSCPRRVVPEPRLGAAAQHRHQGPYLAGHDPSVVRRIPRPLGSDTFVVDVTDFSPKSDVFGSCETSRAASKETSACRGWARRGGTGPRAPRTFVHSRNTARYTASPLVSGEMSGQPYRRDLGQPL
jgi:hypothetical protein